MSQQHNHQCPRPSCRHIWSHSEPTHGWRGPEHHKQAHTCPSCGIGEEYWKCDKRGQQNGLLCMIEAYEAGELPGAFEVEFFQRLVNTGLAWSLQGSYGRRAAELIRAGLVVQPS